MKTKTLILRIALGTVLILLAGLSALPMIPPRVVPATAPASRFSAERAMADLAVVAAAPHAAGSEAQAQVRAYILEQTAALGLQAEVETSGPVSNILVRLPGTDSTGTVLVTGHYDSHPPAPGAGDDGLSTVTMLEALRVLQAGPALRNDLLFLFTDGEELGWLGAYAYLENLPDAKQAGSALLCFDGRPGNGPLLLTETSPGDAWLVRQVTGLPLSLYAGSWSNRAERGEIDTDCSVFFAAGYAGYEIENAEKGVLYHTPGDAGAAIAPGLLQGYGRTMMALVDHFGAIDLRTRTEGPDLEYFSLPLAGLVAYPPWVTPTVAGLGLVTLLVWLVIGWRRKRFSFRGFLWSLLGVLVGVALIVLGAQLSWGPVLAAHADEAIGGGFEASTAWQTGFMAAASVLTIVLLAFLVRRFGGLPLSVAGAVVFLLVWTAAHLLLEADPLLTTAYLVWPFLGSVAGMGTLLFTKKPLWKAALLALSALPALVFLVPQLILASYTHEAAGIPVLAVTVALGLFGPQVEALFGRAPAAS